MPSVEFDMETSVPPDRVLAALTDFSERRPDIWPGLWRGAYEVYEVGESSAFVREGNKRPKTWARERYDWSTPGTVRWEVVESNFCKPGSFVEARISPHGTGSRIHVTWSRQPTGFRWWVALALIKLTGGAPVKSSINAALEKMARPASS